MTDAQDELETRTAVRCTRCGSWLVRASSVHARLGPVCAREMRAAAQQAQDIPLFEIEGAGW